MLCQNLLNSNSPSMTSLPSPSSRSPSMFRITLGLCLDPFVGTHCDTLSKQFSRFALNICTGECTKSMLANAEGKPVWWLSVDIRRLSPLSKGLIFALEIMKASQVKGTTAACEWEHV